MNSKSGILLQRAIPRRPDVLRNALIQRTVQHAFDNSPFYNRLYSDAAVDVGKVKSVADLRLLPLVDKPMFKASRDRVLAFTPGSVVSHIQHTSGTTGEPLLLYRSIAETEFIREFFGKVHASEPPAEKLPILLQVHTPHHGTSTPIPSPFFVLDASVDLISQVEHIYRLLQTEFEIPGVASKISFLTGGNTEIYLLTTLVADAPNLEVLRDGLKSISLTGEYLTSRWRRRISETWDAKVTDRFSMSEVFGGATYCHDCGGYHFDPHVVPELIDRRTGENIDKGEGVLVLTSLYPFVQLHPMIRYMTGDAFRLDPEGCILPRFEFRGRLSQALLDPVDPSNVLLDNSTIIEVLDELPEVLRSEHYPSIDHPAARTIGLPRAKARCSLTEGRLSCELQVDLRVSLQGFPERYEFLRETIRTKLLEQSPILANKVRRGSCDLAVTFLSLGLAAADRNYPSCMQV